MPDHVCRTEPHGPHGIDRGPWGTWHCPGVAEPAPALSAADVELTGPAGSALRRVTVAIATALDGDGGIDAEWLAKVVIDALVDWAGEPSPDAAVVDAALAWADDRLGLLLDDPDRRAWPADLALLAAVNAWRAFEDGEPGPCQCCEGRRRHRCGDQCQACDGTGQADGPGCQLPHGKLCVATAACSTPPPAPAPARADLRDAIIDALSPHSPGCQDGACSWCDQAARQADGVIAVFNEHVAQTAAELVDARQEWGVRIHDPDGRVVDALHPDEDSARNTTARRHTNWAGRLELISRTAAVGPWQVIPDDDPPDRQ